MDIHATLEKLKQMKLYGFEQAYRQAYENGRAGMDRRPECRVYFDPLPKGSRKNEFDAPRAPRRNSVCVAQVISTRKSCWPMNT